MELRILLRSLCCGFCVLLAASAQAQETKIADPRQSVSEGEAENFFLSANTAFYSRYFFRGLQLYDQESLQPSVGAAYDLGNLGSIGVNLWMQIPLADSQREISIVDSNGQLIQFEQSNKFVELDPSINYDYTIGSTILSVGHIWYTQPDKGENAGVIFGEEIDLGSPVDDTAEWYAAVSVDTLLNPQLTIYANYRKFDYQYYSLSFSETVETDYFGGPLNLTPSVLFGFVTNGDKVYNEESGLKHILIGMRSNFYAGSLRFTPFVQYTFGFDEESFGFERTDNSFIFGFDVGWDGSYKL